MGSRGTEHLQCIPRAPAAQCLRHRSRLPVPQQCTTIQRTGRRERARTIWRSLRQHEDRGSGLEEYLFLLVRDAADAVRGLDRWDHRDRRLTGLGARSQGRSQTRSAGSL